MISSSRRAVRWRLALLTILAAFVAAACAADGATTEPGMSIDAFVETLAGEEADLADFSGTPLVVNFFAKSCPPCVAEMPAFETVSNESAGRVAFVGVSEDATSAAAREIIEVTGVTYPIVWDRDGTALMKFRALGLPTTLFVGADGIVVETHTGALSAAALRDLIAEHF